MSQELTIPITLPLSPQVLAERIAEDGAILTLAGFPVRRYLVGHLAWLDAGRMFWFTAHGDSTEDGHVLEFDEVHAVSSQWICFYHAGTLVGRLAGIRSAGVDDPDDYLIAWQLWHEVAPRRTTLINRCLGRALPPEDGLPADPTHRALPLNPAEP